MAGSRARIVGQAATQAIDANDVGWVTSLAVLMTEQGIGAGLMLDSWTAAADRRRGVEPDPPLARCRRLLLQGEVGTRGAAASGRGDGRR